jgi:membrane-bound serine protease (ClpP class)
MALLRGWSLLALALAAALALPGGGPAQDEERPRVLAVEFANDVNPVTQDYLTGAIDRADDESFDAVVILMDTPGGLGSSMRAIIKSELDSEVPVVVYVAPPGASADSAGAFLAMAADVAAMAPQTNIGSSTPVSVGGEEISSDMRKKVVNDAAAQIRELAEEHGRNGDVAEDFVREATNVGAREAEEKNVVDVVAEDLPSLLREIDGMRTKPKGIVLNTAGADVERIEMGLWKRVLDTLIDPNLIVLFMSLGVLGITIEILNPGLIFPGTIGAISLIIGLFGLQVLPVSAAGVLLLLLAVAFFVAEAFVASHGALSLAGAACFIVGALMLFDPAGEAYQVSKWVAFAIGGTLALVIGLAIAKVVDLRRTKPRTGEEEMLGEVGVVREPLVPTGLVFIHGELWRARAENGPIAAGERVEVVRIEEGLLLDVRRVGAPGPEASMVTTTGSGGA